MAPSNFISHRFVLLYSLFLGFLSPSGHAASIFVCGNDQAAVAAAHAEGRLIVGFSGKCGSFSRYKMDFPSGSTPRICAPSASFHIKADSGYIATSWSADECGTTSTGTKRRGNKIEKASNDDKACSGSTIPTGYVVVSNQVSDGSNCTSDPTDKAYNRIINAASKTTVVKCDLPTHDLPDGFVITEIDNESDCGSSAQGGPGKTLRRLNSNSSQVVCHGTKVPGGFAYRSNARSSKCAVSGTGEAFKISPVSKTEEFVCARTNEHIPEGYGVIRVGGFGGFSLNISGSGCGGIYRDVTARKYNPSGMTVCSMAIGERPLPDGYIITQDSGASSTCNGLPGYKIKQPTNSSGENICTSSPIPAGWGITSIQNSSACVGDRAKIEELTGNGPYDICAGWGVPAGYVITHINSTGSGWSCNTLWTVKRPSETPGTVTSTCGMTDGFPLGFVVTAYSGAGTCSTSSSTVDITKPRASGTHMCAGGPIPPGFVVAGVSTSSACGPGTGNRLLIKALSGPGTYCANTTLQDGYVFTAKYTGNHTNNVCGGFNTIVVDEASDGVLACSDSPRPSDYVVTAVRSSSACSSGRAYRIQLPHPTKKTAICTSITPAPAGYSIASFSPSTNACGSFGNEAYILPNGNTGAVVPSTFVNSEADVTSLPPAPQRQCDRSGVSSGVIGTANKNSTGCN